MASRCGTVDDVAAAAASGFRTNRSWKRHLLAFLVYELAPRIRLAMATCDAGVVLPRRRAGGGRQRVVVREQQRGEGLERRRRRRRRRGRGGGGAAAGGCGRHEKRSVVLLLKGGPQQIIHAPPSMAMACLPHLAH